VDITLADGERMAALTNAITYTDSGSEVQIVAPGEARAREQIRLPITVTAKGALYGVDMQLKLDRSLYSEVTFEKAAACAGAISSCTVSYNGIVKISMASSDALVTDGPIGYLVLTPANLTASTGNTIQITSALFNAVSVSTVVDCNLIIRPSFSISGRITYYNSDEGIEGVKVTLSNGMVTYTDENGNYTFTGITTNQIVVTPHFSGSVNNAVSAQDASLVLQAITDETVGLTDLQFLAADVDGDGVLTSLDASYILQKSVGKIEGDFPGSGAEWAFSDSRRVLNLSDDLTNVDFTGVLLGDVTGDWTSTPAEELE
jgi:hypothetical protein